MPACAVATCKNYSKKTKGSDVSYFAFPKNEVLRNQWLRACCRKDKIDLKHARICSIHFPKESIEIPLRQRLLGYRTNNTRYLKDDAVPLLHMPSSVNTLNTEQSTQVKNIVMSLLDDSTSEISRQKPIKDELTTAESTDIIDIKIDQRLLGFRTNNNGCLNGNAIFLLHMSSSINRSNIERSSQVKKTVSSLLEAANSEESKHILIKEEPVSTSLETVSSKESQHMLIIDEPINTKSVNTNIDLVMNNNMLKLRLDEIDKLTTRVRVLEDQNVQLMKKVKLIELEAKRYQNILTTAFTPGQVKILLNPDKKKKIQWMQEDISFAISLHSVSPKAYKYLRKNNYPLPAISTLASILDKKFYKMS